MRKLIPQELRAILEQVPDRSTTAKLYALAVEGGHVVDLGNPRLTRTVLERDAGPAWQPGYKVVTVEIIVPPNDLPQVREALRGYWSLVAGLWHAPPGSAPRPDVLREPSPSPAPAGEGS